MPYSGEMHVQPVNHTKSGTYASDVLNGAYLNPFLVRVRSRDFNYNSSTTLRETCVWVHLSQADEVPFVVRKRRFQREGREVIENATVIFTDHSGLQTHPKLFEKRTQYMRKALLL